MLSSAESKDAAELRALAGQLSATAPPNQDAAELSHDVENDRKRAPSAFATAIYLANGDMDLNRSERRRIRRNRRNLVRSGTVVEKPRTRCEAFHLMET